MKTLIKRTLQTIPALILGLAIFSFTAPFGGDTVEIYQGDKLLLRQHIHIDKEIKTVSVDAQGDKVYVYYSHCGTNGKSRQILVRDQDGKLVKSWSYADSQATGRDLMECRMQEVLNPLTAGKGKLYLYYNSKEMGGEKMIAALKLE